jgi:hypothetical protein
MLSPLHTIEMYSSVLTYVPRYFLKLRESVR